MAFDDEHGNAYDSFLDTPDELMCRWKRHHGLLTVDDTAGASYVTSISSSLLCEVGGSDE